MYSLACDVSLNNDHDLFSPFDDDKGMEYTYFYVINMTHLIICRDIFAKITDEGTYFTPTVNV